MAPSIGSWLVGSATAALVRGRSGGRIGHKTTQSGRRIEFNSQRACLGHDGCTGSDERSDGGTRITAGHQAFANENRVRPAPRVGEQVGAATHPGFGDFDHVGRQTGAIRAKQSRSTSSVLRLRAFTPITVAPACSARSASSLGVRF